MRDTLGTFVGKFAFRSTGTGSSCYLTSYIGQGTTIYPSVSAPALTDSEKMILYARPDGGYFAVLVVRARLTGAISLAYLKGQPELGFVSTDPLPANAQEVRISSLSDQPGTWSIYDTSKGAWTTLGYVLGSEMALLTYEDAQAESTPLTSLQGEPLTQGYADLVATKKGQKADLRYVDLTGLDLRNCREIIESK